MSFHTSRELICIKSSKKDRSTKYQKAHHIQHYPVKNVARKKKVEFY